MTQHVLANADLVLPDGVARGAITLEAGRIASIDRGAHVPAGAVDCGGDMVMPGLIELHTDNLERHIEPRPGVDWPHPNAIIAHDGELAACGITTVFDALRVGSIPNGTHHGASYARAVADDLAKMRAADALRITHLIHLRAEICSETLEAEMAAFGRDDAVGLVSVMDHTPGARQFRDMAAYRAYRMGRNGLSEAEYDAHVGELVALKARVGARHEALAVAEAGRLGAILASHDDTTDHHVRASARHGMAIAEFPTTMEAAAACREHGLAVMMGAPNLVRGRSHSGNVAAADLARAGQLDIVSSDYVPSALLMAAMRLGNLWDDVARGVATVTAAPAKATGLTDRGELAHGLRADVIRVATIAGAPVVRETWVAGRRVG